MRRDPIATYRLQLKPGFGFAEAIQIIPYLAKLGISHLYTSPFLQAVKDSEHGYNVVDPTQINAQIGTAAEHALFCETLHHYGLGLMIDMVPNHMAISGKENPWWWDVLENGPSSRFAIYFDVDWDASEERWPNKVLLPVLSDHYGVILEKGELQLSFQDGAMVLNYLENSFPIDPTSLAGFLAKVANTCHSEMLAFFAECYARLPRPTVTSRPLVERRHRDKAVLFDLLQKVCREEPETLKAICAEVEKVNRDPDALDALLELQNYRLALWSAATRDLGYRRFFDIKDLVGLRMEDFEVFLATHALPIEWYKSGCMEGLRIDHPDGLRNPGQYFEWLQQVCPNSWVVAEKILMRGEKLPAHWKVDGTTGYEFLNLLDGLFIDPKGKEPLTQLYHEILRSEVDFKELVYASKIQVIEELLGSELNQLSNLWVEICERHRRYRDYSREDLREALKQVAACFPVYRSYVSVTGEKSSAVIEEAIELAKKKKPLDPDLFDFLKDLLSLRIQGTLEGELAMRFQQFTAPVMAKGYEDTALYRYCCLISLDEVGGDPSVWGVTLQQFHEACLSAKPLGLLASTTHDTKHSEDFRARLAVLTEMPDQWRAVVLPWMERPAAIDRNIAYLFYQTVVGAWPISEERMQTFMAKAVREAKEHTSWIKQNKEYEEQVERFVSDAYQDNRFISELGKWVDTIKQAGRLNSLSQTLIKLCAPGVPDIYQGCELWNLSLVDPDNRKEVNFSERIRLLEELKGLTPDQIMARMEEGLPKLWIIYRTLQVRPSFGPYKPYVVDDTLVSFFRGDDILVLAPRLGWKNRPIPLPEGAWRNVFHEEIDFNKFPVALLERVKA